MSRLREEIERHRLARAAGGNTASSGNGSDASEKREASAAPPPFLRLIRRDKQCWLLPWTCFHGVSYESDVATGDGTGKCEHLRLVFMSHDVSVRGHNLGGVVDAIGAFALRELREVSESYQAATAGVAAPAPVVSEINVVAK
jgi:hypothetical protein